MRDEDKTREQLMVELRELRDRVAELENDRLERTHSEETPRDSEDRFQSIFNNLRDGLLLADTETKRFIRGNPAIHEMLCYGEEELSQLGVADIHPELEAPLVIKQFEALAKGEIGIARDVPVKRKDGTIFYADITGSFLLVFNGRDCLMGVFRDVTERRRAQEALQESEKRFRALVEMRPDALTYILALDDSLPALYVSPQAEKIFGYATQEFLRDPQFWLKCIHPDDFERVSAQANRLQNSGQHFISEYRIFREDGQVVWLYDFADLIRDEDGRPVSILGVAVDITGRKREEEQTSKLDSLKEQLLAADSLGQKLKSITDGTGEIFGADFAGIWLTKGGDLCDNGCIHASVIDGPQVCRDRTRCLHLVAGSGRSTSNEGSHHRVPLGCYKIGRVASGESRSLVINDTTTDPLVHGNCHAEAAPLNHENQPVGSPFGKGGQGDFLCKDWARNLGLMAFAGFRLLSAEHKPMGVLALFRKGAIQPVEEKLLQNLANTTSRVILAGMAEEALRESEARFRAIFDHSPIGISISCHGVTMLFNEAGLSMFGYEENSEIAGTPQLNRIAPHRREEISGYMRRRERGETVPGTYETEGMKRDGTVFPLYIRAARVELADGPAVVAFFDDITRRKAVEGELSRYRSHLEELVKERTAELAGANEQLMREIEERRRAELALLKSEETLQESEKNLRSLTSQLFTIQEGERARISKELHDGMGQELTVVKISLTSVQDRLRKDQQSLRSECDFLLSCINGIIEETRRLCHDLSPHLLEVLGLLPALEHLFAEVCQRNNMICSFEMEPIDYPLPRGTMASIYRIFQEALTNIVKHSKAGRVSLFIKRQYRTLLFLVADNGKGFDIRSLNQRPASKRGMGLFAMTERAHMLGGSLQILSQKGEGTQISFSLPLTDKGKE
jgi:PAS domain S-box-containing protein